MTIRKRPHENPDHAGAAYYSTDPTLERRREVPHALDHAIAARDFDRVALILLVSAMSAIDAGTIDDVIAVLAEAEAFDDAGA
jgi:hypothetical protein